MSLLIQTPPRSRSSEKTAKPGYASQKLMKLTTLLPELSSARFPLKRGMLTTLSINLRVSILKGRFTMPS